MVVFGKPVWVQALCQPVEVEDRCAFLDDRMASMDFMPLRVNQGSAEDRFLEDVIDGCDSLWGDYNVQAAQADHVLARLGMLHMCKKCMIDPKCSAEDSKPQVRHTIVCHHGLSVLLTVLHLSYHRCYGGGSTRHWWSCL